MINRLTFLLFLLASPFLFAEANGVVDTHSDTKLELGIEQNPELNLRDKLLQRLKYFTRLREDQQLGVKDPGSPSLNLFDNPKLTQESVNVFARIMAGANAYQELNGRLPMHCLLKIAENEPLGTVDDLRGARCNSADLYSLLIEPLATVFLASHFPVDGLTGNEKLIDILSDQALLELLRYLPASAREYERAIGKEIFPTDLNERNSLTHLLNSIKARTSIDYGELWNSPGEAEGWWKDINSAIKQLPFEVIRKIVDENLLMMSPFRRQVLMSAANHLRNKDLALTSDVQYLNLRAYRLLSHKENPFLDSYLSRAKTILEGADDPAVSFLMKRFGLRPLAAREYLAHLLDPAKKDAAVVELLAFFPPEALSKLAEELRLTKLFRNKDSAKYFRSLEMLSGTAEILDYLHRTPFKDRATAMKKPEFGALELSYSTLRKKVEGFETEIAKQVPMDFTLKSTLPLPDRRRLHYNSEFNYPFALIGDHSSTTDDPFKSEVSRRRELGEVGKALDMGDVNKAVQLALRLSNSPREEYAKFQAKGHYLVLRSEHPIYKESFLKQPNDGEHGSDYLALYLGETYGDAKQALQAFHDSVPDSGIQVKGFYRFGIGSSMLLEELPKKSRPFLRAINKNGQLILEAFDPLKP